MDMFTGILSNQAPVKQTATGTIATLCDRLQHATLLEDRRAAVQGLRSFAREYRESVASGGLRALIGELAKDAEDTDTVKVVLETILMLFARDQANVSTEQPDDISLWLADEFTQKQDNISLLIDLLDTNEFYSRLYSLQILSTIMKHRPDRTRECIYTAVHGIARLAAVLEQRPDMIRNEMVRNEGVTLLTALTENNVDIQKLVAFESTFERCFSIIEAEGGVDGGVIVQDCLQLISNLLAFNVSNQSLFRESSCFPRLANLLRVQGEPPVFAQEWRIINLCHAIAICRLFVVPGGTGTTANQISFWNNGITAIILHLAFSGDSDQSVKTEALTALADTIRANPDLQQNFAQLTVDSPLHQPQQPVPNGDAPVEIEQVYVIEGLLDLALLSSSVSITALNMRIAASKCIQAYFFNNPPIRMHFLNRAIEGFSSGTDETANILLSLMELDSDSRADPYKTWLSGVIFFHLISDDPDAKKVAMGVTSGNEEEGEEVVTAIQTFSANLIAAIQHNLDDRISVAFLMALCMWLFDDPDAVDDFLSESSSVDSLIALVKQSNKADIVVQGLCAFLLGIIYEFSHKDSPITRAKLHTRLSSSLGRDLYVHKLDCLRKHPLIRDFEVSEDLYVDKPGLPGIFFDSYFVDFLKDNFSRVLRAIDKDPGEARAANVPATRASAEMVESLKAQLESKEDELSKKQTEYVTLEHQCSQQEEELRRLRESSAATIQKVKDIATSQMAKLRDENDALQDQYTTDMAAEREANDKALRELKEVNAKALRDVQESMNKALKDQQESMLEQQRKAVEVARMELESMLRTDIEAEKRIGQNALREAESRFESEKEAWRRETQAAVEAARKEVQAAVDAAQKEAQAAVEAARKAAQEQLDMALSEEKGASKQAMRDMEAKFSEQKRAAIEAALRDVTQQKDAAIAKIENEKSSLQSRIQELEADALVSAEGHEEEANKLRRDLEALQKKFDAEVKRLKDENADLKKKHEAEIKKSKDAASANKKNAAGNEKKLSDENKNLKDEIAELKKKHEAELKKARDDAASGAKKASTGNDKKLTDENKKLKSELEDLKKEHEAEIKKLKEEAESQKANGDETKKLEEENKSLKETVAEKEEKAKNLQTELDDLFMVMSDLEDKKKEYKAKLKEMGGEVSEDDEEEEEDE